MTENAMSVDAVVETPYYKDAEARYGCLAGLNTGRDEWALCEQYFAETVCGEARCFHCRYQNPMELLAMSRLARGTSKLVRNSNPGYPVRARRNGTRQS